MIFTADEKPDYGILLELLENKKSKSQPAVAQILQHHRNKNLQIPLGDLVSSLLHMLMNRIFKSQNRLHEMVGYDFLYRYYMAQISRAKVKKKEA